MNRKTFFKSIAALGVAVGIAPKVFAEKPKEENIRLNFKSYPNLGKIGSIYEHDLRVHQIRATAFVVKLYVKDRGPVRCGDLLVEYDRRKKEETDKRFWVKSISPDTESSMFIIEMRPLWSNQKRPRFFNFRIYAHTFWR